MNKPRFYKPVLLLLLLFSLISLACGLGGRLTNNNQTPTPANAAIITPAIESTAPAANVEPTTTTPPTTNRLPIQSVVQIWTLDENNETLWSGSGSIISPDGYILTNAHVVTSDKYYTVHGLLVSLTVKDDEPPQPTYIAETVTVDESLDLAIIRVIADTDGNPVDPQALHLPAMALGDSDKASLGMPLRILGYPGIGGETITLTSGEVAGFTGESGVKGRAYIKTSATIAGGNSGGAGIDDSGELIGVPTQLGTGGDAEIVDCRVLADTNQDGVIDDRDACIPTGGFINALRPINLAKPLIEQAFNTEQAVAAEPTATPERSPISLPDNPGEVLFQDDFSADQGEWGIVNGITIDGGQINLRVEQPSNYVWSTIGPNYADVDFQVDAEKLGGPDDNSFGQVFRFQDEKNFYTFEISSDGYYTVNKYEDGVWSNLIDWTASPLINQGQARNQISTIIQGNYYTFLINGVQVDSMTQDGPADGGVGLIASSYAEPNVDIGFDNVLVRTPGGTREIAPSVEETQSAEVNVIYQDDFSSADPGWNLESDDTVKRSIENGEFLMEVIEPQTDAWATHATTSADVVVEVEAHKVGGPDMNNFGIICRYRDADNYYFLQYGSDGTYAVTRFLNGEATMLVEWANSTAMNTGEATNLLRVECVGNTISQYANNTLLASVEDNALSNGQIALAVGTYEEGDVSVKFDNLTVSSPDVAASANVLFSDDFSANSHDWPEKTTDEGAYYFSEGEYYLNPIASKYMMWARTDNIWDNVQIEVDARQTDGPVDNEYGIACRYQDSDNFYQFGISGDGYYRLARWSDGNFEELVPWDKSSAVNESPGSNHLSVLCDGTRLALSVNGNPLIDVSDDGLPQGGDVAMYVGTFEEGNVSIAYDNINITAP